MLSRREIQKTAAKLYLLRIYENKNDKIYKSEAQEIRWLDEHWQI